MKTTDTSPKRFEPIVTSMMTPEDSKRVADAACEVIEAMRIRHDSMCANMEANHFQSLQR